VWEPLGFTMSATPPKVPQGVGARQTRLLVFSLPPMFPRRSVYLMHFAAVGRIAPKDHDSDTLTSGRPNCLVRASARNRWQTRRGKHACVMWFAITCARW
jgi:hypothetical protein